MIQRVLLRIHEFRPNFLGHPWRLGLVGWLCAWAFAPHHYWMVGVGAMVCLMVTGWHCASWQKAWKLGWWWGWGLNIGTLYWVGHSLWVDAARFAWLWPWVVLGLPAIVAIYPAMVLGITLWARFRFKLSLWEYLLVFSIVWSILEWVQGHALTGFPWNLTAYIWGGQLAIAQMVAFLGSYGLGFVSLVWMAGMTGSMVQSPGKKGVCQAMLIGLMGWAGALGLGQYRLWKNPTQFHANIRLRCVQPALSQKEKMDPHYGLDHWNRLLNLSWGGDEKPSHIIWPEGCFPWCLIPDNLRDFPDLGSVQILFGADYQDAKKSLYNSLFYYSGYSPLRPVYAKIHLVPGGEYFPLRSCLKWLLPQHWLQKITLGEQDFSAGPARYIVNLKGLPPFRCLICYESIFPGTIRNPEATSDDLDPQWILTITNDGWFGQSWGPYQHFLSARFRAIEEGLPLVRAANTGISAIVDPLGRIISCLPLSYQGVLDGPLPCAISKTGYSLWHGRIGWLLIGIVSCLVCALRIRRYRSTG